MLSSFLYLNGFAADDGETKCRAAPRCRLNPDASAVPFRDFLADRQADSCARILGLGVKPLKNDKDAVAVLWGDADAVVTYHDFTAHSILNGGDVNSRNIGATKLHRICEQVLQQLRELHLIAHNHWQPVTGYDRTGVLDAGFQVLQDPVQQHIAVRWRERFPLCSHTRKGKQVVNQSLHAFGTINREVDEFAGLVVKLVVVALGEQLRKAGYRSQRLLQVVGGHIGKLLQLHVRPLQVLGTLG